MSTPSSTLLPLTGDNVIDAATNGFYWQLDGSRTINWSIANGFFGEFWLNPAAVASTLNGVFNNISSYANIRFKYVGYYTDPSTAWSFGSDITISMDGSSILFGSNSTWALGFFPDASYDDFIYQGAPGDVFLNLNSLANFLPSYAPGSAGYALAIHEIGHALGLKHPFDDGGTGSPTLQDLGIPEFDQDWFTVMAYNDDYNYNLRSWDPATPMVMDVLALQYLYGPNNSTNASNTTYSPVPNGSYRTIWDAGGTDLVNVSASLVGWEIVLPFFQPSTLIDTKVGLAVPAAEAALSSPFTLYWLMGDIENAAGSAYADGITGNDFANSLTGNAGHDLLAGGGGNDTINGGSGADTLQGDAGADIFIVSAPSQLPTAEIVDGGPDTDTLRYAGSSPVTLTLSANLTNIERIELGAGIVGMGINAAAVLGGVTIIGNGGANFLVGTSADDTLNGGAGSDTLDGSGGIDSLIGGLGNDIFVYDGTSDAFIEAAGEGADAVRTAIAYVLPAASASIENVVLTGTAVINVTGNDGPNVLTGNTADNVLNGLVGNDTLNGSGGNDTLIGGAGNDSIDGGTGIDLLDYSGSGAAINANLTSGVAENDGQGGMDRPIVAVENVLGTAFNDTISGGAGANELEGTAGNDVLAGAAGNDTLLGGEGGDTLNGGIGLDSLSGGDGDDVLLVVAATDLPAAETVDGGGHDTADILRYTGVAATLVLSANVTNVERIEIAGPTGTSNSVAANIDAALVGYGLTIAGSNGANVITGSAFADNLQGGGGNDTFRITHSSQHDAGEVIDGGTGANAIVFMSAQNNDNLLLRSGVTGIASVVIGAPAAGATGIHVDTTNVGAGLQLTGNTVANEIYGTLHNDTVRGGLGVDTLHGQDGDDFFLIGNPAEYMTILGTDGINGGSGTDTIRFISTTANQTLVLQAGAEIERVAISNAAGIASATTALHVNALALTDAIELVGNAGANRLTGGLGDDILEGRGGNDRLDGGAGTDTASYLSSTSAVNVNLVTGKATGSAIGTDTLLNIEDVLGSSLNDVLTGGLGVDLLDGAGGNDLLAGGQGNDALNGGGGFDTVTYAVAPIGVSVNLGAGIATDGLGGTDTLDGIENITGSNSNDTLSGDAGGNSILGGAGDDVINGYDGVSVSGEVSEITATRIASGLNQPVFAGAPLDDPERLFVLEKPGIIKIVDLDTNTVLPTPFLDLTAQIDDNGEQGLLGLAFHPDFAENGYFYVNLINNSGDTEIRRYQVSADPNVADAASGTPVITIDQPAGQSNHKAGWLEFGPDGYLYAAVGDGGGGGDPQNTGQNLNSLLGKMLRLDVDGDDFAGDATKNYAIPSNNPFISTGADEIWAMGLRNPWRNGFDRETGQLYIADVGQGSFEEVNLGQSGANYGWDNREGPIAFPGGEPLAPSTILVDPIHFYDRTIGQSITGGYVYRGPGEALQGHYFFADFSQSRIFTLYFDGDSWDVTNRTAQIVEDAGTVSSPSSFGQDGLGNLYVVDIGGEIFRLTPISAVDSGDTLRGMTGNDTLFGGPGDDILDGGSGVDAHNGGDGNDIILIASPTDHPLGEVIDGGDGDDTIRFTSATAGHNLILRNVVNVENVVIGNSVGTTSGTTTLHVNASSLTQDVKLTGNSGINSLIGGSGDDTLIGGAGKDNLQGSGGDDVFLLAGTTHFPAGERIQGGTGNDTLRYTGAAAATLTLTNLVTGIEHVQIADAAGTSTGTGAINVNAAALQNSGITLTGNDGNNSLTGTAFADTVAGGGGDDFIHGGAGVDQLIGGNGSDIFLIVAATHSVGETITGGDEDGTTDTIRFAAATAGQTLTLGAGVTGIESVRISNSAGSTAGTLTLHLDASGVTSSGLTLIGNAGANRLEATNQDDTLNGGTGRDTLLGGGGDDVFLVGNSHFAAGERIEGGEGDDRLYFTNTLMGTLTLNAGVTELEVVQVSDSTGATTGTIAGSINASLVNNGLTINGNNGANTLIGTAQADAINGNGGNDLLGGGVGADSLDGGTGNDTLVWDAADVAVAGGEGTDTLRIDGKNVTVDLVGNATVTDIEIINLTGSGNNRLSIGAEDVLAITTGDATGTLRINGNLGDEVELVGDWAQGANVVVGGITYRSYTLDGATVRINAAMPAVVPVGDSIALTGNALIDGLTQGGAWKISGERVITYSLDRNFDGATAAWTTQWQDAMDAAFAAWESLVDVDFVEIGSPGAVAQNKSTANISLALAPGEGFGIIAALGIFPDPQFANLLLSELGYSRAQFPRPEGDIVFDNLFFDFSNLQPGSSGFEIILHEIGHALGLKHSDDDGANGRPTFAQLGIGDLNDSEHTVMVSGITGGPAASTPMILDVLAIQHIYGANMSHGTGDDTYVWDDGMRTIWDAGGVDTLDTSAQNGTMSLDLRGGESSGPTGISSDRTGIAFGAIIEKAIGGSQADSIRGNDADNTLTGGGGNDTLTGNAGDDVMDGGAGTDWASYFDALSAVNADIALGSATGAATGNDTLVSIESLSGSFFHDFLVGDDLVNRLLGWGGRDTLDGGAGNDLLDGGSDDDVLVWDGDDTNVGGGGGVDTLKMGVADDPLNLAAISDDVISGVEIIDLLGNGSNLLTLTVADVLAISSETDTLRIDGDGADTVAMGGGWADGGVADGYHTYTQSLAALLIDADITQTT